MRHLTASLLGVLLLANAASALELEEVQQQLGQELSLRIEHRGASLVADLGPGALQQPLLWKAASMRCVDYSAGAAECVVLGTREASPSGVGGSEIQVSSLPLSRAPGSDN